MANKNRNLIIAYYPTREEAERAATHLKEWDSMRGDIKLGGIGIITVNEHGKLKTEKVGARASGTGAKWGTILGATAGILSGGVTLIGGAVVGLAAGTVAGVLFHKQIGMSDEDKDRLLQHLQGGGAALAAMADDDEVEATKYELMSVGGSVENYAVPEDTLDELEAAADAADVEETEEAELAGEEDYDPQVPAGMAATVSGEGEDQEQRTAVLHYHRYNSDYDGWGIHTWYGHKGETGWHEPLPPAGSDDFGVYFEVPVAADAQGLAYIIHRGDEKDLWDDQYLDFAANGTEVWIMQNTPGYVPAPEGEEE